MSWLSRRAAHRAEKKDDFFHSLALLLSGVESRKVFFFPLSLLANPSGFLIGFVFALHVWFVSEGPRGGPDQEKKECRSVAVGGDFFPKEEPKVRKL